MHPFRKQLGKNPIFKALSSVKITVVCLSLLFILTLWGTIDQINNGLYLAQARFFHSWAFTFWGFIPFPGARLVLWVMFINLVSVASVRLVYQRSKAGIIIIHFGLLMFFVAAFVTFHGVEESNITLLEGEGTNVSTAYHNWELSLWTQDGDKKKVVAFDADQFQKGQELDFKEFGFKAVIHSYCRNCRAYNETGGNLSKAILNSSGINSLMPSALTKEPEKNVPGVVLQWQGSDQKKLNILLFGGENKPFPVTNNGKTYYLKLRLKRFPVPFILKLKEFKMERHPNTEVARSYESLVEVLSGGTSREILISMNEPMRYKSYTLYQASYSIDGLGRERSTLAVVKNQGRLLPYIATFMTFAGLVIHLLLMAFPAHRKGLRKKK